jgi:hypothetical protein
MILAEYIYEVPMFNGSKSGLMHFYTSFVDSGRAGSRDEAVQLVSVVPERLIQQWAMHQEIYS